MRIELPRHTDRLGGVFVHWLQEIYELDSGPEEMSEDTTAGWQLVRRIPAVDLNPIKDRMAIVVPVKDERLKVLQGVIAGIPHQCLIIIVSNSSRDPVDRYRMEREAVFDYCRLVRRPAVMIHQRDPGLAAAFEACGLPELIDATGLVRHGKGEGMISGIVLARLAAYTHVGFVDADNYVPGAVNEYVNAYAAGFTMAKSPYAMVRVSWKSKPSYEDGRLFFPKWGRTSELTNQFLNKVLSDHTGFGTDAIATGNAGEHALTMELAMRLNLAGGFAIEPHQLMDLFAQFGGILPPSDSGVMHQGVEIFQIESLNPHFHDKKGQAHIEKMRLQSLGSILHSPMCPPNIRREILDFMSSEGLLPDKSTTPTVYPPLFEADLDKFVETLQERAKTFGQVEHFTADETQLIMPIPTRTVPFDRRPGSPPEPFAATSDGSISRLNASSRRARVHEGR